MKKLKIVMIIIITLIFFILYALLTLTIDNQITFDDEQAIISLGLNEQCVNSLGTYAKEIQCLKTIQVAVQNLDRKKKCPVASDTVEPIEFLNRNYGCCVDRARFIEKAARFYGYDTRHLFIIHHKKFSFISNFLPLGQGSHGASEILTTKGWLGVDSNEPFILIGPDNLPYKFQDAINIIEQFPNMIPKDFYKKNLTVIYGLYSRHGNFHGKNFPGPEFAFSELKWNWIE